MKKIGIIAAMESELQKILEAMGSSEKKTAGKHDFYVAEREGKQLIASLSGIGKVNASVCAQLMISVFSVDVVINTGVAGGLLGALKVFDVVVATDVCHHDLDNGFIERRFPFCSKVESDETLRRLAVRSCEELGVPCRQGRIISGEIFVSDSLLKEKLISDFAPIAVDMESAAIGQVCFLNSVPFASIRSISDSADDEGEMSFDQFEKEAAVISAKVVMRIVEKI